jgi:hypothetical protein
MMGVITARHVLRHPVLVVRGFGWVVFARCLLAAVGVSRATFLSIACAPRRP